MGIFKRTRVRQPEASVAQVKRPSLTCAQLVAALEAVKAVVYRESTAMPALHALCGALARDGETRFAGDPVRVPDGPLPVTCAEVDEAIAEVSQVEPGEPKVDAAALRTLKKARDLLADAEKRHAAERAVAGPEYVTRQQLDDLLQVFALVVHNIERARDRTEYADGKLGYRLERIAEAPEEYGLSGDEHRTLRLFMALLDGAGRADGDASRKRAAAKATSYRGMHF